MPCAPAARTTRRRASTPRRWPSTRGKPRAAAQRPLPSMMIATCRGTANSGVRTLSNSGFDISSSSHREDLLFFCRQHLVDLDNDVVGRLLHLLGRPFALILADLVVLLQLLEYIETVASNMTHRDLGSLRILVSDLDQVLATILIEFGNAQSQDLPVGRWRQSEVGRVARLLDRMDHGLVPDLDRDQT